MTELTLKELVKRDAEIAINSHIGVTATYQRIYDIVNSIKEQFKNSNIELLHVVQGMILEKLHFKLIEYQINGYHFEGPTPKVYDGHLNKLIEDYTFKSYDELLSVHDTIGYIVERKLGLLIANEMEHHFLQAMGNENVNWIRDASDTDKHFIREIGTTFEGAFRNVFDALEIRKNKIWKLKLKEFIDVSGMNYDELEKLIGSNIATVHLHVINGDLCFNLERNQLK